MPELKRRTPIIAEAISDTVKKCGGPSIKLERLLPFARCVELTLDWNRDSSDTIPAVRFCVDIGIPVCFRQLGVPYDSETITHAARRCVELGCQGQDAPSDEKAFRMAFSKINMWGEKFSGLGTPKMLSEQLLKHLDAGTVNKIRAMPKMRIGFIGDSLMARAHWGAYGGYPDILQELFLELNPKVEVFNAAIGGQTSVQGLARLGRDILARKPDLCFVAFGGNDLMQAPNEDKTKGMEKFSHAMEDIAQELMRSGVRPVFLNGSRQYWIDDSIYKTEIAEAIELIGRRLNVSVIDSHKMTWAGSKEDWLCLDDLHLNNSGQIQFAKEVLHFLLGLIRS